MATTFCLSVLLLVNMGLPGADESVRRARSQFDSGEYAEAVQTLTSGLSQAPQEPALHYWLARSYYELKDNDKAVNHAELAVKYAPKNSEYTDWLGRAYGAKAEESHSFFLARKVKRAFEEAVRLNPLNILARRDLMQYLTEAPWIVGGDKTEARKQIDAITALDPLQGRLAKAAYLETDKQWKEAEAEYLAIVDQKPAQIDPYMQAANYFADRKDAANLERTLEAAARLNSQDPRQNYYLACALILRGSEPARAEQLLKAYLAAPEHSDYPSHKSANQWLNRIRR
jgi:cytochrome c-type biogenesis protein CcmH/NrfG